MLNDPTLFNITDKLTDFIKRVRCKEKGMKRDRDRESTVNLYSATWQIGQEEEVLL